eukprot:208982_1
MTNKTNAQPLSFRNICSCIHHIFHHRRCRYLTNQCREYQTDHTRWLQMDHIVEPGVLFVRKIYSHSWNALALPVENGNMWLELTEFSRSGFLHGIQYALDGEYADLHAKKKTMHDGLQA